MKFTTLVTRLAGYGKFGISVPILYVKKALVNPCLNLVAGKQIELRNASNAWPEEHW